ncbi:hypothetical protein H8959_007593 [Pygathrix nigripes]
MHEDKQHVRTHTVRLCDLFSVLEKHRSPISNERRHPINIKRRLRISITKVLIRAIRNAAFSEVGIGISANAMLLLFHVLTCLLKHRIKPTDLIIGHVALIHIILLLPTGFIATDIFGSQDSGDDIKHKSVMYMYRLMRGLSISTTCLLSVLPAITCNPRSSCLAMFKDSHITSHIAFSSCGSSTYPLGEASESPLFPSKMLPQIALHLSLNPALFGP